MEKNQFNFGPPEILPHEVEFFDPPIGEGSFGMVYRGRCRSKDVAIKKLHNQVLDESTILEFKKEVEIVSKIFHPNIVLFMGACFVPNSLMIVTELMPKGNLERLLQDSKISLSLTARMKMIRDAALAMTWLHGSTPQFIHRDFKTSNLLVGENNTIKICDFGLSQIKKQGENISDGKGEAKGTPLWMAPEVLAGKEFNEKADVYSFGIVLWEVFTREEPFQEFQSLEEFIDAVCNRNIRPAIPRDCPSGIKRLIECCWQRDPSRRPSFPTIVESLDWIIIDCAIKDEIGRRLWKERFIKEESVAWDTFLDAFLDVLDYYGDKTFSPLPEQPSAVQLAQASNFQLNEYSSRSLQHSNTVNAEFNRRNHAGEAVDSEDDLKILCLKLLVTDSTDSAEVVTLEKFGNALVWFGPILQPGTNRVIILDTLYDVLSKPWFHGEIGQSEAEHRLAKRPVGTFLIRFSSIVGCYTVSKVSAKSTVAHQRIIHQPGHGFSIGKQKSDTLSGLVQAAAIELELHQSCPGSRFYREIFPPDSKSPAGSGYIQQS